MIHRYIIPEAKAILLVALLMQKTADLKGVVVKTHLTDLAILDSVDGIVVWGFEDKYTYNPITKLSTLTKKGLNFNIDIYWKDTPPKGWLLFEVHPLTPSHY